jgi:hypothetical protein
VKFIAILEPCENFKECALVDLNGVIISHSQGLPGLLNTNHYKIDKLSISLFADIQTENLHSQSSGPLLFHSRRYYTCQKLVVLNHQFFLLYFFSDINFLTIDEDSFSNSNLFNNFLNKSTNDSVLNNIQKKKNANVMKTEIQTTIQINNEKTESPNSNSKSSSSSYLLKHSRKTGKVLKSFKILKFFIYFLVIFK